MIKGYVTIRRAAEILRVSVETLRNWDDRGDLPAKRDKSNGYRLYRISDLEKFAQNKGLSRRPPPKFKLTGDN